MEQNVVGKIAAYAPPRPWAGPLATRERLSGSELIHTTIVREMVDELHLQRSPRLQNPQTWQLCPLNFY